MTLTAAEKLHQVAEGEGWTVTRSSFSDPQGTPLLLFARNGRKIHVQLTQRDSILWADRDNIDFVKYSTPHKLNTIVGWLEEEPCSR